MASQPTCIQRPAGTQRSSWIDARKSAEQIEAELTRVEITLDETGEMLYKSGLLEPGSYVPEANLLKDLDPGSYPCTATIYAYKLADEGYIGKVAAGLTLTVEG